jgi:hypothetical protein
MPANLLDQQPDGRLSPHDAMQSGCQAGRHPLRGGRGRARRIGAAAAQWCDEAVAPVGSVHDVAAIVASIAQCLAQGGHMNGQVALDDDGAAPDRLEDVVLRNEGPDPLDQQHQDVEGTASKRDPGVSLHEHALRRPQREGSEADDFLGQGGGCVVRGRGHRRPSSNMSAVSKSKRRACTDKARAAQTVVRALQRLRRA